MTIKQNAKELAKRGRYGDDSLLHVSKEELKGLASLHPEGKLPKNPDTGLPEAFFFLPFLAGIGSALGAGTAATAATLGTTAATTAATAALPTAATLGSTLGTAALPAAAETAALSAVPATTAALPAATSALTGSMSTPALLGSGGLDTLTAAAPTVSANAPLLNGAMNAATTGAITPSPLATAVSPTTTAANLAAPTTTASPLSTAVTPSSTIPGLNAAAPTGPTLLGPAPSTTSGLLSGGGLSQLMQYGALGAMMMPQSGAEMEEEKEDKIGKDTYHRGKANFNDDGDGEHDYFPKSHYSNDYNKKGKRIKFADGGIVSLPDGREDMVYDDDHGSMQVKDGFYNMQWTLPGQDPYAESMRADLPPEEYAAKKQVMDSAKFKSDWAKHLRRETEGRYPGYAQGGLVRGYAEGGLASMEPQGGGDMDDAGLIDATRDAIVAQSPEADALIQQFVATFGKDALRDLIAGIQQGDQGGNSQGDGMSDSIPATINGPNGQQGLASLSEGEFVMPADVVSGLGNGDTQSGAKQLQGMVDRTRQMRNGATQQPPPINPSDVMPR